MARFKLNQHYDQSFCDATAEILEKENGYVEKKKNGSVWVKIGDMSCYDHGDHKRIVEICYSEHFGGRMPPFVFFDHPAYFVANDKSVISIFRPYSLSEWIDLAEDIWEKGLYIRIYPSTHPCSIVIRYRKEGDDFKLLADDLESADRMSFWDRRLLDRKGKTRSGE